MVRCELVMKFEVPLCTEGTGPFQVVSATVYREEDQHCGEMKGASLGNEIEHRCSSSPNSCYGSLIIVQPLTSFSSFKYKELLFYVRHLNKTIHTS